MSACVDFGENNKMFPSYTNMPDQFDLTKYR